VKRFEQAVQIGLQNVADKTKRLSLKELTSLLAEIPPDILKENQLDSVFDTLNVLTRLPREDKVRDLLTQMKAIAQGVTGERKDSDAPKTKKKKHQEITIYRVGTVTREGRAAVREGGPVDTVGFTDQETVEDAIARFFRAQGSEEDRDNWKVRKLAEDFTLQDIATRETPAKACLRVALLRKGG